jgi:hypothetical protein
MPLPAATLQNVAAEICGEALGNGAIVIDGSLMSNKSRIRCNLHADRVSSDRY